MHSGVRVLLTTHSEWILEALANLVRLSELPEERREGIPGADVALTPDQVGRVAVQVRFGRCRLGG